MKKLYFLNEEEKQRIINMHKDATRRNYLTEDRMLLNENPILRYLRNLWERTPKIQMKKIKPSTLISRFKNQLADFLDDGGNLIIAKPTNTNIQTVEAALIQAQADGQVATANELRSQLNTLTNGGQIYEIERINLSGLDWPLYLEKGTVPSKLSQDGMVLIKKTDLNQNLGSARFIKYDNGNFSKLDPSIPSNNTSTKFAGSFTDVGLTLKTVVDNYNTATNINKWIFRGVGIVILYYAGRPIGTFVGGIIGALAGATITTTREIGTGVTQGVTGHTPKEMEKVANEFVNNMCNKKNEYAKDFEEERLFVNVVINNCKNKDYSAAKKLIKNRIKNLEDVQSLNGSYTGAGKCFWEHLRTIINDDISYYEYIITAINDVDKETEQKQNNVDYGKILWDDSFPSVQSQTGDFDDIELNQISRKGYDNCSCIYKEVEKNTDNYSFIKNGYKEEGIQKYEILLQIGDKIYHPNCGEANFKEYTTIYNLFVKYYNQKKELGKKIDEIKNKEGVNINDVSFEDEKNDDGLVIGSDKWLEKYQKISKNYNDFMENFENNKVKCN